MTRFLGNGQRPIGTITIMAHTSSVYAIAIFGAPVPQNDLALGPVVSPDTNFSAALSNHHAPGSVARNEGFRQRPHRRVVSEALR